MNSTYSHLQLLDHPLITQRYFFPRRAAPPEPSWVEAASGDRLACLRVGDPEAPRALLHFHGNGEVAADHLAFASRFTDLGCEVLFAEYRGYGASQGAPALGSMLEDVPRLLEALGRPPGEVLVFGRSIGSLYALEAAARQPGIAGLVLESGIADVLERLLLRVTPAELGTTREALEAAVQSAFDHAAKLRAYPGPLLILHAAGDDLVTPDHAARNHAWASSPRKRLVLLPEGDHNSIMFANAATYWSELHGFVEGLDA